VVTAGRSGRPTAERRMRAQVRTPRAASRTETMASRAAARPSARASSASRGTVATAPVRAPAKPVRKRCRSARAPWSPPASSRAIRVIATSRRARPAGRTEPATARGAAASIQWARSAPRGPVRGPRSPAPACATAPAPAAREPSTSARPSCAARPPISARPRVPSTRTASLPSSVWAEAAAPRPSASPAGATPSATRSTAPTASAVTPPVVAPVSPAIRSPRLESAPRPRPASHTRCAPSRIPPRAGRPGCATVRAAARSIPSTRPAGRRSASTPRPASPHGPATDLEPV
jgi:hypothetical protein